MKSPEAEKEDRLPIGSTFPQQNLAIEQACPDVLPNKATVEKYHPVLFAGRKSPAMPEKKSFAVRDNRSR
jgi:hypothetical protein